MKGEVGYSFRSFGFGRRNEVRANRRGNGESELWRGKKFLKNWMLFGLIKEVQATFTHRSR